MGLTLQVMRTAPVLLLLSSCRGDLSGTTNPKASSPSRGEVWNDTSERITCGMRDERKALIPPDYVTFRPPGKGASYVDAQSGCVVRRLTDGLADYGTAIHHNYATMSPMNSDGTKILVLPESTGSYYVIDPNGKVLVRPGILEINGSPSEPMWSRTNPNVIYYHWGNRIKKVDITNPGRPAVVVLHTFAEYGQLDNNNEGDLSDDGDHMGIAGTRIGGASTDFFIYTISTDTKGSVLNVPGSQPFDNFKLTHSNRMIIVWGNSGARRFQGTEFYDSNMNFIRQVLTIDAHLAPTFDPNSPSVEYIVEEANADPHRVCNPTGWERVNVDTGERLCLLTHSWSMDGHISSNNQQGWLLSELTDDRSLGTDNDNGTLPINWQSLWEPYHNELTLFRFDGTQLRRLVHHRSRARGTGGCTTYWSSPRAALSMDAKYVIFDSNMARIGSPLPACKTNYTDVYLIPLDSSHP